MGCVCTQENNQFETKNEFNQNQNDIEEKFLKNKDLMNSLIKLQAIVRGRYFRKNIIKNEANIDEPLTFNFKKISTYILIGLGINLIISLILNVCFIIPFQRVNWIIKSTYINIMEEEGQ